MIITTTSERLKEAMKAKGLRQVDLLSRCKEYCEQNNIKLGRNDLSQYVSGKVKPKTDKLGALAHALGVDLKWLEGHDVPMDKWERVKHSYNELTAFDAMIDALGWKYEYVYCPSWDDYRAGVEGATEPPAYCMSSDGIKTKCESCHMKDPKCVFSRGATSFEVSEADYSAFRTDVRAFYMKRIQELMLKSSKELFK